MQSNKPSNIESESRLDGHNNKLVNSNSVQK